MLNVQDLANLLASGNATVTTTGSGVQANNIRLNARLQWSAATTLALDAFRSIEFHRGVTVAGPGTVALKINDGGSGGEFACVDQGRLQFANLSSALTINGVAYVLVDSVAALAGAIAANPSGGFALANNYNAKKDGTYAVPPIPTVFSGSFNGLGNTISNLSINDPTENSYVGFFAETVNGSTIDNVRLMNENVRGGAGSSESSTEYIGGLVGYAQGGAIANGFTSGTVIGEDNAGVGGLLGVSGSTIASSESTATVSNGAGVSGGLVGLTTSGSITDSYAAGNVLGSGFVGGLVGFVSSSPISHSWSSGSASSSDSSTYVGGLVGMHQTGIIARSSATGSVACAFVCGGLVGMEGGGASTPKVSGCFATGSVTGSVSANTAAGGLVGHNSFGALSNSYATGAVSAKIAGGLVGQNDDHSGYVWIARSYATGAVTGAGDGYSGGLIGYASPLESTTKHSYWDMTTSGITNPGQGAGNVANDPGITGLSDSKLKSGLPKGFNPKIWNEDSNINGGLPYLIANPPAG
jgi:hypothetical protein